MNITKHPPDLSRIPLPRRPMPPMSEAMEAIHRTNLQTRRAANALADQRMKRGDRSTPTGRWHRSVGPWIIALTVAVLLFVALGYFFGA